VLTDGVEGLEDGGGGDVEAASVNRNSTHSREKDCIDGEYRC
jgi:hypothetical protein